MVIHQILPSSAIFSLNLISISGVQHSENLSSRAADSLHLHLLYIQIQNLMSSPLLPSTSQKTSNKTCAPLWNTVPDMMSLQRKRKYNDRSHSYNKKDLTLQVFKKNTKMIYIRSLLQEYTITKTDKRKCTNQ